jgi:hypothetical protein
MVGGAQSCCHRMIENEKRESWFYATATKTFSSRAKWRFFKTCGVDALVRS